MRCISPHRNFKITLDPGEDRVVASGAGVAQVLATRRPTIAEFQHGGLLDHETRLVLETFSFRGIPEGVNPLATVSVFDTEVHIDDPDERERAERRLRELATRRRNFIIVDTPGLPEPWPGYDEQSAEQIFELAQKLPVKVQDILRYEQEKQNRPEVLRAFSADCAPENTESFLVHAD